ncbi:unnamed protein product [Rhodiola kirilowii]
MSGGTPVAGGLMRQRHSQGNASSGDDLEDDACSRHAATFFAPMQKQRTWVDVLENVLWIASAAFIIYYGDTHSNFIYLLWHDDRIRSCSSVILLYIGAVVGIGKITVILSWAFLGITGGALVSTTALIPWIGSRFSEYHDMLLQKCFSMEFQGWGESGIAQSIGSATSNPTRSHLILLICICSVANLEFLDYPSSVHIVYGSCGYSSQLDDGFVQTTRYAPHRLKLP